MLAGDRATRSSTVKMRRIAWLVPRARPKRSCSLGGSTASRAATPTRSCTSPASINVPGATMASLISAPPMRRPFVLPASSTRRPSAVRSSVKW